MHFATAARRIVHRRSALRDAEPPRVEETAANIQASYNRWDPIDHWSADGDEWVGQAAVCGVSYETWKESLVARLIRPYLGGETLEIAPGHGRWSAYLVSGSAFCTLVDLSPSCLNFCRGKFAAARNVDYFLTNGTSLPHHCSGRIDFLWSYDSFVHMAPTVVRLYLGEIGRVLRPAGRAIIHHADVACPSTHDQDAAPGWRSAVNRDLVRSGAEAAGLAVERQFVFWDEERRIGVPRFGDAVTVLRKPSWRLYSFARHWAKA